MGCANCNVFLSLITGFVLLGSFLSTMLMQLFVASISWLIDKMEKNKQKPVSS